MGTRSRGRRRSDPGIDLERLIAPAKAVQEPTWQTPTIINQHQAPQNIHIAPEAIPRGKPLIGIKFIPDLGTHLTLHEQ